MQKKEMTLIFYHVPEDKDDPDTPNVFHIPVSKQSLKLKHIQQYFPIKGNYIFRFKFSYEGVVVWLDLADPEADVPTFRDKVYLKANRISWNQSKISEASSSHSVKSSSKKQTLNLFDHHDEVHGHNTGHKKNEVTGLNLLGDHSHHSSSSHQDIKMDFFNESKGQSKVQKSQFNLMGHHGDLI